MTLTFSRKSCLVTIGQLSIHGNVFGGRMSVLTTPARIREDTLDLATSSASVPYSLVHIEWRASCGICCMLSIKYVYTKKNIEPAQYNENKKIGNKARYMK